MALDLSPIADDAQLGIAVTVVRSTGKFTIGGFQITSTQNIPAWGAFEVSEDKDLRQIPEGDRVGGAMIFITTTPMYQTQLQGPAGQPVISDTISYGGDNYKVARVGPWSMNGFYAAILVRMTGT